jgi:chorismate mutase
MRDLVSLRAQIDLLDEQIVKLIADRYAMAEQIAEIKKESGLPIYSPEREIEIQEKLINMVPPSLPYKIAATTITSLVQETRKHLQKKHGL